MRSNDRDQRRTRTAMTQIESIRSSLEASFRSAAVGTALTKRDFVNSLSRGLDVLRSFDRTKPSMTLSEVAERAGINRAAARRFLLTFVRDGYAASDGKYFRLLPKVLDLGFSALNSMDLLEVSAPHLRQLSDETHRTVNVAILEGVESAIASRRAPRRLRRAPLVQGRALPARAVRLPRSPLAFGFARRPPPPVPA